MKVSSLTVAVSTTVVLTVPLLYVSYLLYKKQQALLSILRSANSTKPARKKRVLDPSMKPALSQVHALLQDVADSGMRSWEEIPVEPVDEPEPVGLDLDTIPMFTPRAALAF